MRLDGHIPDEDLLQYMDGELRSRRAADIQRHLSCCSQCRNRQAELAGASSQFLTHHRSAVEAADSADGPAARLRAEMAQSAGEVDEASWFDLRRLVPVSLGVLTIVIAWFGLLDHPGRPEGPLPDSRLTPGSTRPISQHQVCGTTEGEQRSVPVVLAAQVFQQYRIRKPAPGMFELDYLISPALGGAEDMQNLWPQPYVSGEWSSRVKDALEDHLRQLVCDGSMDLAEAQHEIASNWIAAYRKHFRTDRPLQAHALFVKDRPWE